MKIITPLILLFFFNNSNSCTIDIISNTNPPRLVNGEWVETKKPIVKPLSINYEKLIKNHSIVFSGIVESGYTEGKEITSYIYVDEVWKGHMLKNYEINNSNHSFRVLDGTCGHKTFHGIKYIFFADIGTRKNPIRILNAVGYDPKISKYLKEPTKRWVNGELFTQ